jgi:hypothetical protein
MECIPLDAYSKDDPIIGRPIFFCIVTDDTFYIAQHTKFLPQITDLIKIGFYLKNLFHMFKKSLSYKYGTVKR